MNKPDVPPDLRTDELPATATAARRRVLVVDDNVDVAQSLAELLQLCGHEVEFADGGLAALALGARFGPELVLLDIGMPGLDGYETARRMRAEAWGARATLVALTGWSQDEDKAKARQAGFDAHMTKPADPDAVQRLLDGQLPADD